MHSPSIQHVFVYGTLKRGEVREKSWPRKPLSVVPATVRGCLYDLGPYPALVEGEDVVTGELWHFAPQDMPPTLSALDEVEGYRSQEDDEYRRVVIQCQTERGRTAAWTYRFARLDELACAAKILLDQNGVQRWSKPAAPAAQ